MYPLLEQKLKEMDWKDEDLAACLKISPQVAYNKRHGRTKISALEMETLARYLKVDEDELFKEE